MPREHARQIKLRFRRPEAAGLAWRLEPGDDFGPSPGLVQTDRLHLYFFLPKIPDPLVWVAIAVWSQEDELLVLASQPDVFGPFGSNWSSL